MSTFLLIICIAIAFFLGYRYLSLKTRVNEEVQTRVELWRQRELDSHKSQLLEVARREAQVLLEQWKQTYTKDVRRDAIQRSQAVTVGKVTEHIVPYLPGFQFDPRDVRFLGTPIDLVVFDGLSDGQVNRIVFVEVKTATSRLSARERSVKAAVDSRRIEWLEMRHAQPSAKLA